MKNRAHRWLSDNPDKARKMLSGTFKTKDIGITREIEELHRFGYVKRLPRVPGGRCEWEATSKLKRMMG